VGNVRNTAGDVGLGGAPRLLERDSELSAIDAALSATDDADGRALLFEGVAGIGKTSLLDEAAARARERGFRVLRARGDHLEQQFPWGVAIQLFADLLAGPGRGGRLRGPAKLTRPLFERGAVPVAGPQELFPLIHGLHWLTLNVAEDGPIALLVDDVHDSDGESLRFLCYLLGRLEGTKVALAVAARPREPATAEVAELLDRLRAASDAAKVEPLGSEAVGALARRQLPDAADAFCNALARATAGNPFLCRELLDEVREQGLEPGERATAALNELRPENARSSLLWRLGRLGAEARRLAVAVAILGPRDHAETARLAGLEADVAADAADALQRAELLAARARLEFAHPLIGEVIREDLTEARIRHLHMQAARLLFESGAAAEMVASHLLEADSPSEPWTAEVFAEAAAVALDRAAPQRAARLLRAALAASPEPPQPTLLRHLGRAEAAAGELEAAERFRAALGLAAPEDAPEIARDLGETLYASGRFAEAAEVFEDGLDALSAPDSPESEVIAAELLAGVNMASRLSASRPPESVRARTAAIAAQPPADPSLGDRVLLAITAGELALGVERDESGLVDTQGDRVDRKRVLDLADRALAGGELPGRLGTVVFEPTALAVALCDQFDRTRSLLDAVIERARDRGAATAYSTVLPLRGFCDLWSGRIAEAITDAGDAIRLAAEVPGASRQTLAAARHVLAVASLERGDLDDARAAVDVPDGDEPWAGSPLHGWYLDAVARVALAEGEPAAALDTFERAGEAYALAGGPGAYSDWRAVAAVAARAVGDDDRALSLADEELRLVEAFGAPRRIAIALRCRAQLAGDRDEAIALLERALEVLEGSEAALERAHVQVDLGSELRRTGRRRDSREPLRLGMGAARTCGARPLVERAAVELEASGARRPELALTGVESLTPSEARVARMAATGLSNREIAENLFVTRKTVEVHLSSVYRKLEISGRNQLKQALAG